MLYAVRYQGEFPGRREELAFQRALAEELLRWALWEERGLKLSSLTLLRTPRGKPFFQGAGVHFSQSHCRGLVCCGLSSLPVGVDAEGPRPYKEALARRVCTGEELDWLSSREDRAAAFLALWTLKESLVKLSGEGLSRGLKGAAFTFPEGEPRCRQRGVVLSRFSLPGGYVVSAAGGERFPEVRMVDLSK